MSAACVQHKRARVDLDFMAIILFYSLVVHVAQ